MSLFELPTSASLQEAHLGAAYDGSVLGIANSFIRATPRADISTNITFSAGNKALKVRVVGQTIEREAGYYEGRYYFRVLYCRDLVTHIEACAPEDQVYGWVRAEDLEMEQIDWLEAPIDIHNRYGVRLDPAQDLDAEEFLWFNRLKSSQAMQDELDEQKTVIADGLAKFSTLFLDEFGLKVDVHRADGRRLFSQQGTPYDSKRFQAAFDAMPRLASWGIGLSNEAGSLWSPQEILYVRDAVAPGVSATNKLAVSMGLQLADDTMAYKIVYGWDKGNQQTNLARTPSSDGLSGWYAVNKSNGKVRLTDRVFARGDRAYGLYGGGLLNSNLRFPSATLIGHEITHNVNYQDDHFSKHVNSKGRLEIDGKLRRLASYYDKNWRIVTWPLSGDHTLSYVAKNGKIVTEALTDADRKVQVKTDSGFTHRASAEAFDYERVTDALNAQAQGLYTIGPYFTKNENLQGLVRREQGETLVKAILDALT